MKTKSILSCLLISICINISFTIKAQAVNILDSLALVDLYDSTHGPIWHNHTNWLTGPVSTWYGITLENNGVTKIDLRNNGLYDTILTSIGNLSNLSDLLLGYNYLDWIPAEIGNLSNLSSLDLSYNQLSSIPPGIGNLANLSF